jgi:hypothetical protein
MRIQEVQTNEMNFGQDNAFQRQALWLGRSVGSDDTRAGLYLVACDGT